MAKLAHKIGKPMVRCCQTFHPHPMVAGSLLFCPDCGTLLNIPQDGEYVVVCEQCGHEEPASCTCIPAQFLRVTDNPKAYENIEIITRSHPDAFPSPLRQKGKTQTKVHEANEALLKARLLAVHEPLPHGYIWLAGHGEVP